MRYVTGDKGAVLLVLVVVLRSNSSHKHAIPACACSKQRHPAQAVKHMPVVHCAINASTSISGSDTSAHIYIHMYMYQFACRARTHKQRPRSQCISPRVILISLGTHSSKQQTTSLDKLDNRVKSIAEHAPYTEVQMINEKKKKRKRDKNNTCRTNINNT